jgi:hypothetical protein
MNKGIFVRNVHVRSFNIAATPPAAASSASSFLKM